jgi:SPP1 family predicted phage head-tail adaptor
MGIGAYRYLVTVQTPGAPVADGDGSYTETWQDATPAQWAVSLEATTADKAMAGTQLATATHQVRGRYHAAVTPHARLLFEGRTLNVLQVRDLGERHHILDVVCAELVP